MYALLLKNIYIHILVYTYTSNVYDSCVAIFSVPMNSLAGTAVNSIHVWLLLTVSIVKNLHGTLLGRVIST
jgi:hypothetical protein